MTVVLLELTLPILVVLGIIARSAYVRSKNPTPRALGRILRKLGVVDVDEILQFKEIFEQEWKSKPHLRRVLRRNQIRIYSDYYGQMGSNAFRFQQVARFEELKIDPGKSSFDYDAREALITDLLDDTASLRSEIFEARVDLVKGALLGRLIDQERFQTLLGKYKGLEHDMVELANMAKDTTCRDMLIERLGLANWRIVNGGTA